MTFAIESFAARAKNFACGKHFAIVIFVAGLICTAAVGVSRAVPIAPLPSAVVSDARAASLPVYYYHHHYWYRHHYWYPYHYWRPYYYWY